MINFRTTDDKGVILPALIIFMTAFSMVGLALASYTTGQYSRTRDNVFHANSTQVAEAGIEQSLYQINQDESFTGYAAEQTFFNNATQGKGVFTTTISATADSNAKMLVSTAKVYRLSNLSDPVSTRKIRVTIVGTNSQGYSVHTGPGGLILGGGASITNSDVYVNGKITMSGSARIGTSAQPVEVNAAHISCPNTANPGPTYPQLCSTGQPISLSGSSRIYGTVCATGQTNSTGILPGTGGEGLKPGCVAPQVSAPSYDRAAHISSVVTTAASTNSAYTCANSDNKSWPTQSLKLTGNVNLGGSCRLLLRGNVYITGNLDLGGAAQVTIDDSLGTTRPVIMVDGTITTGGSSKIIANRSGIGAHLVSFKSTAACNPDCSDVTGTDLKNSQQLETVKIGGSASMPGMIFQSHWGKLTLGGSGNMGAALGQTIDMTGSGTVTFGTILSSGSRSWTVTSYQQIFD